MPQDDAKSAKKYTVDELADLYKKQNPQYANIESTTLVNRILKDHPETAKRMDFGNAEVQWTGTTAQIKSVGDVGPQHRRLQGTLGGVASGIAGQQQQQTAEREEAFGYLGGERFERDVLRDVLPTLASLYGARLPFIKGVGLSGATAGLGGAAGEMFDKGPKEGSWLERRGMDVTQGIMTEAGGRAAAPLIRGVTKPLKFALGGALQDVPTTLREQMSAERGIHFTPAQVMEEISETTGKPYGVFMRGEESRSYHNPYSRAIAKTGAFTRGQAARSTVADLASQIGPDVPENMSMERVANVIKSVGKPTWQRQVDKLKSILNARAARTMVDVTSMKTAAEDELHDIWKLQENLGQVDEEGRPVMPNTSRVKMLVEVSKFPDQMPFSSLVEKRTQWMNVSPQITELLSGEAKGTAKHFTELSTKLLDDAAKSGGVTPMVKATAYEFLQSTELTDEGLKGILGLDPKTYSAGDIVGRKLATKLPNGMYKLTPTGVDAALFQEAKLRWAAANPGKPPNLSAIAQEANKAKLEGQAAAAKRTAPRAGFTKEWNTFRNFTRKGSDVFESKIITDAMNKNPEEVVGALKGDDITDLLRIRRAIKGYAERFGTPADQLKSEIAWRKFQNTYLRENVLRPLDGNMTNLDTAIQNLNPAVKKALFDDPQGQQVLLRLTQIGKAMKDADKSLGVLMGHQDPLAHVGSMAISGAGLLSGGYAAATGHPGLAALGIGISAINMLRPYIVARIAWNPTATRLFLRGLAGLAETPPSNNAIKDLVVKTMIGKGSRGMLKAGGVMTNRRLGAAMADIIRAYDLANIYEEAKEQDRKANEALNKGEIGSPQALEMMSPGSITVPALQER